MTCEKIKSLCVCATFFAADCRAAKGVPSRGRQVETPIKSLFFFTPRPFINFCPSVRLSVYRRRRGRRPERKDGQLNFETQQKLEIKVVSVLWLSRRICTI